MYRTKHQQQSRVAWRFCTSCGLLAAIPPLLPGRFQLAVAFQVDLLLPPRQHVLRRDIAGGTVQADVVVVAHVILHQTPRIIERQRCAPGEAGQRMSLAARPAADATSVCFLSALKNNTGDGMRAANAWAEAT